MKSLNLIRSDGRGQAQLQDLEGHRRGLERSSLVWLLAAAIVTFGTADALSAGHHKSASTSSAERDKPASHRKKVADAERHKKPKPHQTGDTHKPHVVAVPASDAPLSPDLAAAKQAYDLVRQGKAKDAAAFIASIQDPVAVKLAEWISLRRSDSGANFDRYAAFIAANPDWPSVPLMRGKAESRLWTERRDAATVRRFVGNEPASPLGRLALARAELAEGDRTGAENRVRAVWRSDWLSDEVEAAVLAMFPGVVTRADHVARMDRRIGAKDFGAAMRAAKHAGDDQIAIVKACSAAEAKSAKGGALLDAVGGDARNDLGYALCRVHWLLRNETPGSNLHGRIVTPKGDIAAAVKLALAGSPEDLRRQDTDEWWRERRALARKLIDLGDTTTAYQVVRNAAPPVNPYYRAEVHFLAGWIALRYLGDPAAAQKDFAHIDDGMADPLTLSRAAYWRARAAEAAGQIEETRAQYLAAARYPTAYYGQLARARLGLDDIVPLQPPPAPPNPDTNELLHAADILYRTGEGDLVLSFMADLANESRDPSVIAGLGKLTAHYNDAQAMLQVGKIALARGLPMDLYAFPDIGVPDYKSVGSRLDRCIVYSIVRTESAFDQSDMSPAKAVGLMQVTPGAGRDTAKRFGVSYDWNRLVSDPAYNTQMGAAEISALLQEYRGSFILTFAGYNAGRGRVQQWMAQHGDPRDPKIDAVDWIERIPFAETRNYVQRVMENLQVYRKRFGDLIATTEPNLHRASVVEQRPTPAALSQPLAH